MTVNNSKHHLVYQHERFRKGFFLNKFIYDGGKTKRIILQTAAIFCVVLAVASASHLGLGWGGVGHLGLGHGLAIGHAVNPAAHIPSGSVSVGPNGAVVAGPAGSVSTDNGLHSGRAGAVLAGPAGTVGGWGHGGVVAGPAATVGGWGHGVGHVAVVGHGLVGGWGHGGWGHGHGW